MTSSTQPTSDFDGLLTFARDAYGIWSWCLYEGGEIIASCNGFDSRPDAAQGFFRLKGIPVESLNEAAGERDVQSEAVSR